MSDETMRNSVEQPRFAAANKPDDEPIKTFIKRNATVAIGKIGCYRNSSCHFADREFIKLLTLLASCFAGQYPISLIIR